MLGTDPLGSTPLASQGAAAGGGGGGGGAVGVGGIPGMMVSDMDALISDMDGDDIE